MSVCFPAGYSLSLLPAYLIAPIGAPAAHTPALADRVTQYAPCGR